MNPAAFPPPPPGPPTAHRRTLRPPRGRARLALLALLLLALGVGGYVTTRGGWVNALRLPPTLDAATPRAQNGWVLEDIQLPTSYRGSYHGENDQDFAGFSFQGADYSNSSFNGENTTDAFGIWLTPPTGSCSASTPADAGIDPKQNLFVVSAQLSTGESLFLSWHLRRPKLSQLAQANMLLFISLPTGYPDTCRFVDITVSDQHSQTAHWRITRLPRMRRAIPAPVAAVTSVTKDGVTLSAQAWLQPNSVCGYLVTPTLPPSHSWELGLTKREYTWASFNNTGEDGGQPLKTKVTNKDGAVAAETAFQGYTDFNYYPRANRFLRLTTELRQFETHDETLIFHNVAVRRDPDFGVYCVVLPKPLSQTTPSGVTVTLPTQDGKAGSMAMNHCLNVLVSTSPKITFQRTALSLPASPLARAYGKPVRLSLTFTPPGRRADGSEGQGNAPSYYAISLWGKRPLPSVLKDFTITVHQRVDLQATPMTFTLPIADHAPPLSFESDYDDYNE